MTPLISHSISMTHHICNLIKSHLIYVIHVVSTQNPMINHLSKLVQSLGFKVITYKQQKKCVQFHKISPDNMFVKCMYKHACAYN